MPLVDVPFIGGQDNTVDSKIAPTGVLRRAVNIRVNQQGRIVKRNGLNNLSTARFLIGTDIVSLNKIASLGEERVLFGDGRLYGCNQPNTLWRDRGMLPDAGVPERREAGRNKTSSCVKCSVAVYLTWICVVYEAGGEIHATIIDSRDWTVRDVERVSDGTGSHTKARVVVTGSTFRCVWMDLGSNQLSMASYDLSSAGRWSTAENVATPVNLGVVPAFQSWDLHPYDSTSFLMVWQSSVGPNQMTAARVISTGILASTTFTAIGLPTCCGAPSERCSVCWVENGTGALRITTFAGAGSNPFGGAAVTSTIATSARFIYQPSACRKLDGSGVGTVHTIAAGMDADIVAGPSTAFYDVTTATNIATAVIGAPGAGTGAYGVPATKVTRTTVGAGDAYCWHSNHLAKFDRTYSLQGWTSLSDFMVHTTVMRGLAAPPGSDQATHWPELIECLLGPVNTRCLVTALAFVDSGPVEVATIHTAIDIVVTPLGAFNDDERFQTTEVGGLLYISGGLPSVYDGQLVHESGFLVAPRIVSATPQITGGGALVAGQTYSYVVTREWVDAKGQLHLSQVSDLVSVTLGGADNSVLLRLDDRMPTNRNPRWETGGNPFVLLAMRYHVWRTLAGQSVFYRVTPADGVFVFGAPNFDRSYNDVTADTAIAGATGTNIVLYTQGARGGLSGPLQHEPPPPCKYLWAGKDRIIVGGLEKVDEVRWSKTFFPGEAVEFSEDFAFRKRMPGRVKGVAALDDAWVIFGESKIWTVFGDGPDDSGVGTFTEPRELPSSVGLLDARSLLSTPMGLFFQARTNGIYLLPRGGGAPVWIGEPIKSELEAVAGLRVVSAVLVPNQDVAIFTISGAVAYSRNLVYHFTRGIWSVDIPATGTLTAVGSAVWDGFPAYCWTGDIYHENEVTNLDDVGAWYGITIETHWLRPGGMQASVRVRKASVLGEHVGGDAFLNIATYTDDRNVSSQNVTWSITATDVGGAGLAFRREWRLSTQKCGSVRFTIEEAQNITVSSAGFALNGLTFEVQPRGGMPRLPESSRA